MYVVFATRLVRELVTPAPLVAAGTVAVTLPAMVTAYVTAPFAAAAAVQPNVAVVVVRADIFNKVGEACSADAVTLIDADTVPYPAAFNPLSVMEYVAPGVGRATTKEDALPETESDMGAPDDAVP